MTIATIGSAIQARPGIAAMPDTTVESAVDPSDAPLIPPAGKAQLGKVSSSPVMRARCTAPGHVGMGMVSSRPPG